MLQLREQLLASNQAEADLAVALSAATDGAVYGTQAQPPYVLTGMQSSSVEALQGQSLELQMAQLSLRSLQSVPAMKSSNGQHFLMDGAATSQPHAQAQARAQPVRSNSVRTSMRNTVNSGGTNIARSLSFNKQAAGGCSVGSYGDSFGMRNCEHSASLPLSDARPLIGSFQELCGYVDSNVDAARESAAAMHAEQQGVALRAAAAEKMEQLAAIQRLQLEIQQDLLHMRRASPREHVL